MVEHYLLWCEGKLGAMRRGVARRAAMQGGRREDDDEEALMAMEEEGCGGISVEIAEANSKLAERD